MAEAKVAEATRLRAMKKEMLANLGVSQNATPLTPNTLELKKKNNATPQRSIIRSFNAYADEETIDEPIDEDLEL